MNKTFISTESEEQQALFQWARLNEKNYPELRLMYHIPNGGLRNKSVAVRLTAEGVRRGVPDICLPVARSGYHGMYIELKRRKGGIVSKEQTEWLELLAAQNYLSLVCYGWDEAREAIKDYLGGT
jgi:hypothetical protein